METSSCLPRRQRSCDVVVLNAGEGKGGGEWDGRRGRGKEEGREE